MPHRVAKVKVLVVIEADEPGFHAFCPAFKGLHVDGNTEQEALKNAKDAIICFLDSYGARGEPLPVGPDLSVEHYEQFEVPQGAFLHHLTLQWPTKSMSGDR